MISLKQLRKNSEEYGLRISSKGENINISNILSLDEKVRSLKHQANEIRSERNCASEAIGLAKQKNIDASEAIDKTRELGHILKNIDSNLNHIENELNEILYTIPNPPHYSVPKGINETSNAIIREWGEKPEFAYTLKNHTSGKTF